MKDIVDTDLRLIGQPHGKEVHSPPRHFERMCTLTIRYRCEDPENISEVRVKALIFLQPQA